MEHFLFHLFWSFKLACHKRVDTVSYLDPHFEACSQHMQLWTCVSSHFLRINGTIFYFTCYCWFELRYLKCQNYYMIVHSSMHHLYILLFLKLALQDSSLFAHISLYLTIQLDCFGAVWACSKTQVHWQWWWFSPSFTIHPSLVFHPPLVYYLVIEMRFTWIDNAENILL